MFSCLNSFSKGQRAKQCDMPSDWCLLIKLLICLEVSQTWHGVHRVRTLNSPMMEGHGLSLTDQEHRDSLGIPVCQHKDVLI